MIPLCLAFWGTAKVLSKVAAPSHVSASTARRFRFLPVFANSLCPLSWCPQPILEGGMWLLVVVLIPISLRVMTLGIFFCAFWPFPYLLQRNICWDPLPTFFKLGYFLKISYYWVVRGLMFHIRYTSANILSQSVGCLVPFLMFSFKAPKFLILMKSGLSLFFLLVLLVSYLQTPCVIQGHEDLLLCFFLVVVLALTLRFIIPLIQYLWIMWGMGPLGSFACGCLLVPASFPEKTIGSPWTVLAAFSKSIDHKY